MDAPLKNNKQGVKLNEPSVESPYTSLGSDGSYNVLLSAKNHNTNNGIRAAPPQPLNRTDFTMAEPLHRNDITTGDPLNHTDIMAGEPLNRTDITGTAAPLHTSSLLLAPNVNNTTLLPTYTRSLSNTSYLSLRAKAQQGHAKYESRTKAVMDALQGLQNKIRKIESDRSNAEMNLKCLALETRDYKELLKLKEKLGGNMDTMLKESQSKELETQLGHAQDRCNALEKQLETMRKVMTLQPGTSNTTKTKTTTNVVNEVNLPNVNTKTTENNTNVNGRSADKMRTPTKDEDKTLVATPSSNPKPTNETLLVDTTAIEKLNGLEQEHKRLTEMQSKTEDKINKLDAKIRKEAYHRKLLQDQTNQLHTVISTNPKEKLEIMEENSTYEQPAPPQQGSKMKRKKSAATRNTSESKTSKSATNESKNSTSHSHSSSDKPQTSSSSPSHYLVDFAQIPFVVGRSTSKSHSLGANIQSVLSIMKSHNMLCCDASPASCRRGGGGGHANKCVGKQSELLRSCEHLHELLATLQDEFAQLGFEHREAITQLQSSSTRAMRTMLTKEKDKIVERMETKGKQINIIREHLHKVQASQKGTGGGGGGGGGSGKKRQLRKNRNGSATTRGGAAVGSGTHSSAAIDGKVNPKLDMYKKVKKIQSTLCKGDLKWV